MIIHTATGKELQCDKITSVSGPPRFSFLHLTDIGLSDAITLLNKPGELPLDCCPEYTTALMVYGSDNDVNVALGIQELEEENNA